jgi:GDP-L-fucose synthase
MDKAERVYIPGHNGLLGKSVWKVFLSAGYEVVTSPSSELDLRNSNAVHKFVTGNSLDGIIICAARVGGIGENNANPLEMFHQNSQIQYSLLKAAFEQKIPKLIFVSSAAIYPRDNPVNEEKHIFSGQPSAEHYQYALAKLSAMEFVRSTKISEKLNWISVIPTNIYGENDKWHQTRAHVIAALIMKITQAKLKGDSSIEVWGSGLAKREFLHADDAATAILACYKSIGSAKYDRYNISDRNPISIMKLAKMLSEIIGFQGELIANREQPEGPLERSLNLERLEEFIEWKPQLPLEEGLRRCVTAYESIEWDGSESR